MLPYVEPQRTRIGGRLLGGSDVSRDEHATDPAVLVVEPTPRDARIISCGLHRQSVSASVVSNGREAIDRLSAGSDEATAEPLPDLVVLDLAAESVDALTVLDAIKSSPRLSEMPVVVLTDGGDEDIDVQQAYDMGANAHVRKPDDTEAYVATVEQLASFWFEWVTFPPEHLSADKRLY